MQVNPATKELTCIGEGDQPLAHAVQIVTPIAAKANEARGISFAALVNALEKFRPDWLRRLGACHAAEVHAAVADEWRSQFW